MRAKSAPPEVLADLAALLKERVGLHVKPDGYSALRLALLARFDVLDGKLEDPGAYLSLLRSSDGDEELRSLLPLVTVGKTSFFRDERQFHALEALLPRWLEERRAQGRPVAIWSAGCATGEEPYSIAMSAAQAGARPEDVELLATDVNPEAVAAAEAGRFQERRVRDVARNLVSRYFAREGTEYRVVPELRRLVRAIRPHNLASSVYPRPSYGAWDAIFCRNVIIYFDTPTAQDVLTQFHAALAPGGYLFLGYSESLFRLFDGFDLEEVAGAFLYRRPARGGLRPGPALSLTQPSVSSTAPAPARFPAPTTPSAPRPARAAPPPPPPATPPVSGPAHVSPRQALERAVELCRTGRFGDARDLLEGTLAENVEDLGVRLTLANLYGVLREPERARQTYVAATALEPLSAEAHLFYGIHLLTGGDADSAALELSRALFLDPDLALAHYYLGRCREAQRDAHRARIAYKNAIDAFRRRPGGHRQAFLGLYPDLPEDGSTFARAAEYALKAL